MIKRKINVLVVLFSLLSFYGWAQEPVYFDEIKPIGARIKSSLSRPVKELKGFRKISLEPGEEKTVSFTLTKEDLSYYDDKKIHGLQNRVNSKS
jgi:hypothetical protein